MMLTSSAVYKILKANGVKFVYHANSVLTACQFLRTGALLSRGTVKRRGLLQTRQYSDKIDQYKSLWFDVFTDSVDIHERCGSFNKYGPVLFVLDVDIIKDSYTGGIWVTKLNPTKWQGKGHKDRWFTSVKELESKFAPGQFDQMIVFRHCGGELPIKNHLKEVTLDDPKLRSAKSHIDYYSMAFGSLQISMTEGGLDAQIEKRKCKADCKCIEEYWRDPEKAKSMYAPTLKLNKKNPPVPQMDE